METWHILITIGFVAFIIEIFTAGFIFGSIGIGLLLAALGNYLGLVTEWQILIFALGVGLTYFLIRPIITKYAYQKSEIPTNRDAIVGKEGMVTQEINAKKSTGRVTIDGDNWKASTKNDDVLPVGTKIKVVAIESIVLFVEPLK